MLGQALYGLDAAGSATRLWIDPNGRIVAVLDNTGVLTRATFDARGRRLQSIDPDQGTWSFVHNGLDELNSQTDARGATTTITSRDALGRVRELTLTPPNPLPTGMNGDVLVDQWSYDPANGSGQLDSVLRKRGSSVGAAVQVWKEQYGYEATTRRLSATTSTLDGEGANWSSGVSYDSDGREATRTYPSGLRVRSDYTTWGQLRRLSNADTAATYWTATGADAWGKVTAETFGNGITGTHLNAGSTGQSRQLQWKNGAAVAEQLDYAYDPLGNLKTQARGGITESYSYDPRQRLTQSALSTGATVSFDYDAAGNLRKKSDFSANATNAYSYGADGCGPHAASSVSMPGGGSVTYACDANGNVVGGSALTATFDAENRPRTINRSASGSGGGGVSDIIFRNGFQFGSQIEAAPAGATPGGIDDGSMTFAYDAKGERYVETASGGTTRYGPRGYEKVIAGGVTHRHELGPVVVSRTGSTDIVRYVLRDRLGSTIAVSDAASVLAERRQFDAFGKARNADFSDRPAGQANLASTNRGFTSHTQADDVWLVHMNGRVYDQNLGRFLSVDPIVQGGGSQALNPYSYIQNNPLSGTDPSGYASEKDECAGTKAGGCTVSPTTAATLTGSHIKGASGGANIEVVLVNPTAGGMAELAVAMAGSSSGYVVQTSTDLGSLTSVYSPDIGTVTLKGRGEQSSTMASENPSGSAQASKAFLASAQSRFAAAAASLNEVTDEISAAQFGSPDEAHQWFQSFAQPITDKYGPEIGANIVTDLAGAYWLEDIVASPTFSRQTGVGSMVNIPTRLGDPRLAAYTHTHPLTSRFSPSDIAKAAGRGIDAYVSTPGRVSYRFSYGSYRSNGGSGMDWSDLATDPRFVVPVRSSP